MTRTRLGEFIAHADYGREQTIQIFSHPLGFVEYYTQNGERVLKVAPGRFQYGSFPLVRLTSSAANAQ